PPFPSTTLFRSVRGAAAVRNAGGAGAVPRALRELSRRRPARGHGTGAAAGESGPPDARGGGARDRAGARRNPDAGLRRAPVPRRGRAPGRADLSPAARGAALGPRRDSRLARAAPASGR